MAGGALALSSTPGRAAGPGVFAAPGVLGLWIGGAFAILGVDLHWMLAAMLVATAAIVWRATVAHTSAPTGTHTVTHTVTHTGQPALVAHTRAMPPTSEGFSSAGSWPPATGVDEPVSLSRRPNADARDARAGEGGLHEVVMFALLAGIALRSFLWTTVESFGATSLPWLVALGVAAACGKLLGGFLADAIGWRRWTMLASAMAAPLLVIGRWRPWCLLPGVALLQSTTPVGLAAAGRLLPRHPATAAGLVLGVAIAAGGAAPALGLVPPVETWPASTWLLIVGAIALAAGGLMGLAMPGARARSA